MRYVYLIVACTVLCACGEGLHVDSEATRCLEDSVGVPGDSAPDGVSVSIDNDGQWQEVKDV